MVAVCTAIARSRSSVRKRACSAIKKPKPPSSAIKPAANARICPCELPMRSTHRSDAPSKKIAAAVVGPICGTRPNGSRRPMPRSLPNSCSASVMAPIAAGMMAATSAAAPPAPVDRPPQSSRRPSPSMTKASAVFGTITLHPGITLFRRVRSNTHPKRTHVPISKPAAPDRPGARRSTPIRPTSNANAKLCPSP